MIAILCRVRSGRSFGHSNFKIASSYFFCIKAAFPVSGLLTPFLLVVSSIGCLFPLCGLEIETFEHLFMRCQISCFVWHDSPWLIHMDLVGSISFPILVQCLLLPHRFFRVDKAFLHQFVLCASLVLDSIWHLRNDVVHNQIQPDLLALLSFIRRRYGENLFAWAIVFVSSSLVWLPLPLGCLNATLMLL